MPDYLHSTLAEWNQKDGTTWHVTLNWHQVQGRMEVVGVELYSPSGQVPITTVVWREFPLASLVNKYRADMHDWYRERAEAGEEVPVDGWSAPAWRVAQKKWSEGGRRQRFGPGHFADVAQVYEEAWREHRNPVQAVAQRFHRSNSTASKWVMRARELGFLPPTSPGKARGGAR